MTSEIIQIKINDINVLLTPIQFRIIKMLKKYPEGLIRGQNYERGSLMKKLDTARTTIYDNLVKLQKQNLVQKISKNSGGRGRPTKYWKLK